MCHADPPAVNASAACISKSRLVAIVVLAMIVSACTTYQIKGPESPIQYCAQSAETPNGSGQVDSEFEAIPVQNWTEVYALKEKQGQRVVMFPNQLLTNDAKLNRFFDNFLWFKSLAGSKIVVSLSVSERSEAILQAEQEIQQRYPGAEFIRPLMAEVRLVPVSPWIVRREVVLPCQGFPMKDVPIEFLLNRQETLKLDALPDDALVLSGTLSFVDLLSGHFFQQSFSLRKSELQYQYQ